MKRTGNKNLKIVAATMMTIFSLFTCFSATFAWFLASRKINQENDSFEITARFGRFKSITFHELSSKAVRDSYYDSTFNFNKTPSGTLTYNWPTHTVTKSGNTTIALDGYDYLDHEQPLLLILELDKEYSSTNDSPVIVDLEVDATAPQVFIGERDADQTNAYELDDADVIFDTGTVVRDEVSIDVNYYGLSNAVKFHTIEYSASAFSTAFDGESVYSFTHLDNEKSFVSIANSNDASTYTNHITPLIETTGDVKYIAIIIDYYSDAIEYIYSTFFGDPVLENDYDGFLYFKCDWSMEVI